MGAVRQFQDCVCYGMQGLAWIHASVQQSSRGAGNLCRTLPPKLWKEWKCDCDPLPACNCNWKWIELALFTLFPSWGAFWRLVPGFPRPWEAAACRVNPGNPLCPSVTTWIWWSCRFMPPFTHSWSNSAQAVKTFNILDGDLFKLGLRSSSFCFN